MVSLKWQGEEDFSGRHPILLTLTLSSLHVPCGRTSPSCENLVGRCLQPLPSPLHLILSNNKVFADYLSCYRTWTAGMFLQIHAELHVCHKYVFLRFKNIWKRNALQWKWNVLSTSWDVHLRYVERNCNCGDYTVTVSFKFIETCIK